MNKFDEQYISFSVIVLPKDAPTEQEKDMKLAFYAGAVAFMASFTSLSEDKSLSEEDLSKFVDEIHNTLEEFMG